MRLADEIRILRQKSFLTQTQFAEELQVSFTTVNRWEKGKATPNLSTMKRIKAYCEKNGLPYEPAENAWLGITKEE
jgi:putative transcriptional regulator